MGEHVQHDCQRIRGRLAVERSGQRSRRKGELGRGGAPPPLAEDAISTSPLAYFGDMVQQSGRSMAQDPAAAAHDPAAHGAAMDEAIGMLESVIGLMSLSGESGEAAMQSLATNSAPSLESLD